LVLEKILKREKPRVYLGTLAIAPRSDIKRHFDEWGMFKKEDLDSDLRKSLSEILSLPLAKNVTDPKSNDLVIDVVVPKLQSGDALDLEA